MEDCEKWVKREGYADKWDATANYTSRMLPAIFRVDDPTDEGGYATNDRIKLEGIIEVGMPFHSRWCLRLGVPVWQKWSQRKPPSMPVAIKLTAKNSLPLRSCLEPTWFIFWSTIPLVPGGQAQSVSVKPSGKIWIPAMCWKMVHLLPGSLKDGRIKQQSHLLRPMHGLRPFCSLLISGICCLARSAKGTRKEEATDKGNCRKPARPGLDARCTQIAAPIWHSPPPPPPPGSLNGHYKALPRNWT